MSTFSSKSIPKGFVIALLLVFLFELGNVYFDNYFYKPRGGRFTGLRFKVKNEISFMEEHKYDLLVLGDSHSLNGFVPRVIEENTGLSSFNYAFSSNQKIIGYYWIFKSYIESHSAKPEYVVIGFEPFTTYPITKSDYSREAINHLASLKKGNVLKFIEEFGIVQGMKFLLPSLKHQSRLKDLISDPFSFDLPGTDQINEVLDQVYDDRGYYPHPGEKKSYNNKTFIEEFRSILDKEDLENFVVSPFSEKYLRDILELSKENGVTPIYYVPAFPPEVYSEFRKKTYMSKLDDFLGYLKKDYPELIVFYAQSDLNENYMFKDVYHLTSKGAVVLSESLSRKINEIR